MGAVIFKEDKLLTFCYPSTATLVMSQVINFIADGDMRNGSCTPLWSTSYESLICQFVYDCDSQAESVFRCHFKVTKLSPSSRIREYLALYQSGSFQHFVESKGL